MTARVRTAVVAAAATALTAGMLAGSADAATPGITVSPRNADVQSKCTLVINSYNTSTLTANVKLSAWAQPVSLAGYGNNIYTQVFCKVYGADGTLVAHFEPAKNSNSIPTTNITPTIAYSPSYTLCGQAFVKKRGGGTSLTREVCLTG